MDLAIIVICLLLVVLLIAFIINPPEAWVKRAFKIGTGKKPNPGERAGKQPPE